MSSNADLTEYNETVIFPPANFSIWPSTRVGALGVDVLLFVIFLLLWMVPRRMFRIRPEETDNRSKYALICQSKMWGFWVAGLDKIKIEDDNLIMTKRRGWCCCCSHYALTFPLSSVTKLDLERRKILSLGPVWAFLIGCLCGVWLHFIPCIWWTCDWGYFDGQGVRGAIWFITWGVMFIVLVFLYRVVEIVITIQPDPSSPATEKYYFACGEGSARDRDDSVATYDLGQLKKGIYESHRNETEQTEQKFVYIA